MPQFFTIISPFLIMIIIDLMCANYCPDDDEYTLINPCVINSQLTPPKKFPSKHNTPKLNIVNRTQEIKANDTFEVECFGDAPLEWRIYEAHGDIGERINFTESVDMENKDYQYSSKLVILEAQYTDTSLYGCFDNGTDVDHLSSNPLTDERFLYLYVNDNAKLLLPVTNSLIAPSFGPLIIPCRPTNSRVNVTLWPKEFEKPIALEKDVIEFDLTRGFIIYSRFPPANELECRGILGEVEDAVDINVIIGNDLNSLPEPIIKGENATYVYLGSTFSLTCEVMLENSSIDGQLFWEYPNSKEDNSTGRILAPKFSKKSKVTRWIVKLQVHDAKMSDDGNYTCVIRVNEKSNEATFRVNVQETFDGNETESVENDPNIASKNTSEIPTKEDKVPIQGDNVTLSCTAYKIHFSNLNWHLVTSEGSRQPLPPNAIVTPLETAYSFEVNLTFVKISKDFKHTFTCVALGNNGNETESAHYPIFVQNAIAPKIVSLGSKKKFELKNADKAFLNCTAHGSPFPNITWLKDGKAIRNSSAMDIINRGQVLRIKNAMKESVEGNYTCIMRNRMGVTHRAFNVSVEESSLWDEIPYEVKVVVLLIVPLLVIAFSIALFCCVRHILRERLQKKELEEISRGLFNKGEVHLLNPDLPLDGQVELLPYDHKWEFPKNRLILGRILGQGAFGRVLKAEAIGLDNNRTSIVAVKMLKERADKVQCKALIAELKILIHLGKHLNIVNLLGAVTTNMKKGELLVIVEYCRYGNLRDYLLKSKPNFINQLDPETGEIDPNLAGAPRETQLPANQELSNPKNDQQNYADLMHHENSNSDVTKTVPNRTNTAQSSKSTTLRQPSMNELDDDLLQDIITSTCDLLCYGFQVARGMQYLSSRKVLHRDLAARNVLLADDNVVKICDFGLAKDCYNCDDYRLQGNGPLPIKWMALESLEHKVFTTKSDIWSYGILLWEIFSLGGDPYPGMELDGDFYKKLKNGYRMDKPDYATNNVYRIMIRCWDESPDNRPSFEDLSDAFGDLLHAGVKDFYLKLDEMSFLNEGTEYLAMNETGHLVSDTAESDENQTAHDNSEGGTIPMIQIEDGNMQSQPDLKASADYLTMKGEKSVFSRQISKGNESVKSDTSSGCDFHSGLDKLVKVNEEKV